MDHPLSYKPAPEVARDVTRQINLLNALLELADRHFSALNAMIRSGANPVLQMLTSLERHNYRFAARPYDPELAQTSIRLFLPLYPLYDEELAKIELAIDEFVEANAEKLSLNYDEYGQIQDPPLFLYQPELYLILHALQTDSFVLEERWCSEYPVEELERVATMWGIPLG
jgi:hypothetical protein